MFVGGITEVGYKAPIKKYKRMIPTKNVRYDKTYSPDHMRKMMKIYDNRVLLDVYPISLGSRYEVALVAINGEKKLDIRIWYSVETEHGLKWIATTRGVLLPLHVNKGGVGMRPFEGFEKTIARAMKEYDDLPIHDPEKEVYIRARRNKRKRRKRKVVPNEEVHSEE